MRTSFAGLLLAVSFAAPASAQTLSIVSDLATANIYRVTGADSALVPIGVGAVKLELKKNESNTIVVRHEGFRDVRRSFPRNADYKVKTFLIYFVKRVVQFSVLPADAQILVNGEVKGTKSIEVEVGEGQPTTVEVTKRGFVSAKRVYRWEKGSDVPPIQDKIELVDRKVAVSASPDGAELLSNDVKMSEGDGEFVIKRGSCATITARKAGWIPVSREWCNKDGLPEPPVAERLVLAGRVVTVTAPQEARIFVNQKHVGVGTFPVQVPDGSCVKVRVEQAAFLTYSREYCAQQNAPAPPLDDLVILKQDESYAASAASDQANVNVTIDVGAAYKEDQAWKMLSSTVLNYFDVLENSDAQTGYMRTAWQVKSWGDNNEAVIRTRIIVKRSSELPLRYSVKIVSERNKVAGASAKDDESFVPWDRLLNTYRDFMSAVQTRLR